MTKNKAMGKQKRKTKKNSGVAIDGLVNVNPANGQNDAAKGEQDDDLKNPGRFVLFPITEVTRQRLQANGVKHLFPVQVATFNPIYEGKDVIVKAKTGTGKTFAFIIPIVERIRGDESLADAQVLILSPTRELALQISENVSKVTSDHKSVAIYGGVRSGQQLTDLSSKPTFIVATPGRLLDLTQNSGLTFESVKFVVIDECDRMLDMGFMPDVEKIFSYVYKKDQDKPQTMVFSATVPDDIDRLMKEYIKSDNLVFVDLVGKDDVKIPESVKHLAMSCPPGEKASVIANILSVYCGEQKQAIVFCQTKKEADTLSTSPEMKICCHVLHGDIPQETREKVLRGFRNGKYRVLLTTDVAARGIDIPDIDLVLVTSPPLDADTYIHRSGRTGRAGREGLCICLYNKHQAGEILNLQERTGVTFKRMSPPDSSKVLAASAVNAARSLANVTEEARKQFAKAAKEILSSMSAEDAMSAALAVICGRSEVKKASLLTNKEGYTCLALKTPFGVRSCNPLFVSMKETLGSQGEGVRNAIGKILFSADRKVTYFDLKSEFVEPVFKKWVDSERFQLTTVDELPDTLLGARDIYLNESQHAEGGQRDWNNQRRARDNSTNFKRNWNGNNHSRSDSFQRKRPFNSGGARSQSAINGYQNSKVTKLDSGDDC